MSPEFDSFHDSGVDLSRYRNHARGDVKYFVRRILWSCVQIPFWPKMPRRLSWLRIALLRMFGARIGDHCLIAGGVRVWIPWNLQIGHHSVVGDNAEIYNLAMVVIGSNSVVSQKAFICTATHDYRSSGFPLYAEVIRIESGVWIAADAFLGPGITVGEGSVVGARSVVTRDVPAWTVAAGNPCRPLKKRCINS